MLVLRMEVRNRKRNVLSTDGPKVNVRLHNEVDWDFNAIAQKKLEKIKEHEPGDFT